ncbi:MAG: hypothetical protein ISS48_03305 [Candidatus Aenigmarchaeota archaeon]|nr:hypothetical protein [Candidatus Aenigmarchaeota archaeon]
MKKEEITEEMKELVITRLLVLPPGKKISIGSYGDFTKDELIESVKKGDEIGKKIIEIEIDFLRALKEGEFYE